MYNINNVNYMAGKYYLNSRALVQRFKVRFQAWSDAGVIDYDETCFMHLTPGVVHKFPRAFGA